MYSIWWWSWRWLPTQYNRGRFIDVCLSLVIINREIMVTWYIHLSEFLLLLVPTHISTNKPIQSLCASFHPSGGIKVIRIVNLPPSLCRPHKAGLGACIYSAIYRYCGQLIKKFNDASKRIFSYNWIAFLFFREKNEFILTFPTQRNWRFVVTYKIQMVVFV